MFRPAMSNSSTLAGLEVVEIYLSCGLVGIGWWPVKMEIVLNSAAVGVEAGLKLPIFMKYFM